jgi:hypothetical protein
MTQLFCTHLQTSVAVFFGSEAEVFFHSEKLAT